MNITYREKLNNTIAYLYKWTHIPSSKWYIGSRTAKGCHPADGYLCSSKIVKPLILQSPTEWVRTILVIGSPKYIRNLEADFLSNINAANDCNSFNLNNANRKFTTTGKIEDPIAKERRRQKLIGKTRLNTANYRIANQKKAKDPEYIKKLKKPKPEGFGQKISLASKGRSKAEAHKLAMSQCRKGIKTVPCSDVKKEKIRQALKGKHTLPIVQCPHCGLNGRANMKRWHFDNCKLRNQHEN
jgi:hypothetical protein